MRSPVTAILVSGVVAGALPLAGCGADPQYISATNSIEVGAGGMGGTAGVGSITLPIKRETQPAMDARARVAAALGAPVPYVRMGDLDVELEWTVKNLSDQPGQIRVNLNGANEVNAYVPVAFVIDPDEDEEPPPLLGNIPIDIGPGAILDGVLREDQLREASIDLEQITRAGVNPFAAILTRNEDDPAVTVMPEGVAVPIDHLAQMIRYDLTFAANGHMVLEWVLRVRDHRGLLHDELLTAPAEELTAFMPVDFAPPVPEE